MTDQETCMNAIMLRPWDDLPRLIYADWLEENAGEMECPNTDARDIADRHSVYSFAGPESHWKDCSTCKGVGRIPNGFAERAEFIRIQCSPSWSGQLGDRERKILGTYGNAWCDPLPRVQREQNLGDARISWTWARGFIHTVRGPLAAFWGEICPACNGRGHNSIRERGEYGPNRYQETCYTCSGTGRVSGPTPALMELVREHPAERIHVGDEVIFPSGGNDTYYLGNLGRYPSQYWRRLENHRQRSDVSRAHSNVLLHLARERAGVPHPMAQTVEV